MRHSFLVVLNDSDDANSKKAAETLLSLYEGAYAIIPNTVYLVSSDEIARDIAIRIGVRREDSEDEHPTARGAVFRINGVYAGFNDRSLWEWLVNHERAVT